MKRVSSQYKPEGITNSIGGILENDKFPFLKLHMDILGYVSIAWYFKHKDKEYGMICDTNKTYKQLNKNNSKEFKKFVGLIYENMGECLTENFKSNL